MKVFTSFFSFLLAVNVCLAQKDTQRAVFQKLKTCQPEGISVPILCGTYPVYENRVTKTGRMLQLSITVIPALITDSLLPPLFFIEGGPGGASSSSAKYYASDAAPYRKYRDIVLVDARGTGGSDPLHCPSLQYKAGLKDQLEDMYPAKAVKACFDSLSQIADLRQYTTENVVYDLEEVRQWLGYEKIELLGISYGTRVALLYMKMFPSAIKSCVLWSPVPTYFRMPLFHARFAQAAMEQVFDSCKTDPGCNKAFPNLRNEFIALMKRMKRKPFQLTRIGANGRTEEISISWDAFATKIRTLLYTPERIRKIPYIIHTAYQGNMNPFISLYPKESEMDLFLAEGFYLCVTCAEDVPFIATTSTDSLTKDTFIGMYRIDQQRTACANWIRGAIPAGFHDPIYSEIPTLILSGAFDPVTPVSVAREIASHLPNSKFIYLPQMSHVADGLSQEECLDNIILNFLKSPLLKTPDINCIGNMQPGAYQINAKKNQ